MNVIKKISGNQALSMALVCWFGLTYCLYGETIQTAQVDIMAFFNEIVNAFAPSNLDDSAGLDHFTNTIKQ